MVEPGYGHRGGNFLVPLAPQLESPPTGLLLCLVAAWLCQRCGLGAQLTLRTTAKISRGANVHSATTILWSLKHFHFMIPFCFPFHELTEASGSYNVESAGTVLFSFCLLAVSQI